MVATRSVRKKKSHEKKESPVRETQNSKDSTKKKKEKKVSQIREEDSAESESDNLKRRNGKSLDEKNQKKNSVRKRNISSQDNQKELSTTRKSKSKSKSPTVPPLIINTADGEEIEMMDDDDISDSETESLSSPTAQTQSCKRVSKRVVFISLILGCLFGIYIMPIFFPSDKLTFFPDDWVDFFWESRIAQLLPLLPSSPITLDVLGNLTNLLKPFKVWDKEDILEEPTLVARKLGWKAHYPVVIIPGLTSTGLELWQGKSCSNSYFRERLWGTLTMLRFLLIDKACWIDHIVLDPCTGMDPEGVKLRAAQGLSAADFIMPGYWVWGKIIEALGGIGYDQNDLHMAAYDWRLSMEAIEERDKYFTKLKAALEVSLEVNNGRKTVILAHSLGCCVFHYFMKWVESPKGGNGGPHWVDRHIHAFFAIAGPLLGLPKAISSLISGEMKDTAQLGVMESYLLEKFFCKRERAQIFRQWPCLLAMMPKGGNAVWGDGKTAIDADDDIPETYHKNKTANNESHPFLSITGIPKEYTNLTVEETIQLLLDTHLVPEYVSSKLKEFNSWGMAKTSPQGPLYDHPKYWVNPLEYTLPNAKNMKIYSAYGVGKPTERNYYYTYVDQYGEKAEWNGTGKPPFFKKRKAPLSKFVCGKDNTTEYHDSPILIDVTLNDENRNIMRGIHFTDGDGTLPLISTGLMCYKGWKSKKYNPYNVTCLTREYLHDPVSLMSSVRGGPMTSDHVDILGNYHMMIDILQIVSGNDDMEVKESEIEKNQDLNVTIVNGTLVYGKYEIGQLRNRIFSNIRKFASRIEFD